jgi:hypothetical protein
MQPTDSFGIAFKRIKWEYTLEGATGSKAGAKAASWDLEKSTKGKK